MQLFTTIEDQSLSDTEKKDLFQKALAQADPNARNADGITALMAAVKNLFPEGVSRLIMNGADIGATAPNNITVDSIIADLKESCKDAKEIKAMIDSKQ